VGQGLSEITGKAKAVDMLMNSVPYTFIDSWKSPSAQGKAAALAYRLSVAQWINFGIMSKFAELGM
jgi:hypothetical protein